MCLNSYIYTVSMQKVSRVVQTTLNIIQFTCQGFVLQSNFAPRCQCPKPFNVIWRDRGATSGHSLLCGEDEEVGPLAQHGVH